jgi:hypothetical protein
MFEHFFDANLPFAGLVNCHWPMPLHGLAATGPFREKSCFGILSQRRDWMTLFEHGEFCIKRSGLGLIRADVCFVRLFFQRRLHRY